MSAVATWTVTILGTPRTQGSVTLMRSRSTGKPFGKKTPAERQHRDLAVAMMRRAWHRPPLGKRVPVEVSIVASFPRPASHYGTGRNADVLRADAPATPHAIKPDADKLARLLLDALTIAGVIVDDCQVAVLHVEKRWAPRDTDPWTRVTVRTVDVLARGGAA